MFSFTLHCWDGAEMQVKWIDDDLFKEGNSVDIEMGYRDNLERLFQGEITGLEPEFPNGQPSTLTVRGYDRRHRLMGRRKTRTFLRMKDSDIATRLLATGASGQRLKIPESFWTTCCNTIKRTLRFCTSGPNGSVMRWS